MGRSDPAKQLQADGTRVSRRHLFLNKQSFRKRISNQHSWFFLEAFHQSLRFVAPPSNLLYLTFGDDVTEVLFQFSCHNISIFGVAYVAQNISIFGVPSVTVSAQAVAQKSWIISYTNIFMCGVPSMAFSAQRVGQKSLNECLPLQINFLGSYLWPYPPRQWHRSPWTSFCHYISIFYPLWTSSRRIHGVKPPGQWLDFIEFMSGRPPVGLELSGFYFIEFMSGRPLVGLDPSGFYCLLFWILFDPLGLLQWNKFQRGSTQSGHPRIMTLACVFLQTCPPPDFIWFQSWMTVWLCPRSWVPGVYFRGFQTVQTVTRQTLPIIMKLFWLSHVTTCVQSQLCMRIFGEPEASEVRMQKLTLHVQFQIQSENCRNDVQKRS